MLLGAMQLRVYLGELIAKAAEEDAVSEDLRQAFGRWLTVREDCALSQVSAQEITALLGQEDLSKNELLQQIDRVSEYLEKRSFWVIGGDGWAYDIGYGGLDHVLASGENINVFVMDTEVYSNTGGQASKSTPAGAVAKFAYNGKTARKKDLGLMAMSYGHVYVAQIAMGADMNQTIQAITEAESYDGPSLIIAYAPCISHGIQTGMSSSIHEEKKAVDCGYWQLFRYDPRLAEEGKNPFYLDSKKPTQPYTDFLEGELRYAQLKRSSPERAEKLFDSSFRHAVRRYRIYKQLAERPDEEHMF